MRSSAAVVPGPDFIVKNSAPYSEEFKPSQQQMSMPPRVGALSNATPFKSPAPSTFHDSPLADLTNRQRVPGASGSGSDVLNRSFAGNPQPTGPCGLSRSSGLQRHSSMRPLAAAYHPPRIAVSRNNANQSFRVCIIE